MTTPGSAAPAAQAGAAPTPTAPPAPAAAAAASQPSLVDAIHGIVREVPGMLSDRIELLSLELRRAGLALAQIVVLIVAAAILGVTAWLTLWAGITVALIAVGLAWPLALLLVLLVNAGAVAYAVVRAKGLAACVQLPATRRHLTLKS